MKVVQALILPVGIDIYSIIKGPSWFLPAADRSLNFCGGGGEFNNTSLDGSK